MGQWPEANINVVMEEFCIMVAWEQAAQATVVKCESMQHNVDL